METNAREWRTWGRKEELSDGDGGKDEECIFRI